MLIVCNVIRFNFYIKALKDKMGRCTRNCSEQELHNISNKVKGYIGLMYLFGWCALSNVL